MKHLTDGVFVEYPLVERRGGNAFGDFTVFVFKGVFVGFLVLVGKIVVNDALLNEFELGFHRHEIYEESVVYRLRQLVAVGRHAVFKLKDLVGVFIDLVFGGCRKTDERGIEIVENIFIFVVNGTMCLIHDHKIKVTDSKELSVVFVFDLIYAMDHGLIG